MSDKNFINTHFTKVNQQESIFPIDSLHTGKMIKTQYPIDNKKEKSKNK